MEVKILPYEKAKFEDGEVIVDKVSVTYLQNNDSSGEDPDGQEGVQELTLTARSNGAARFVNLKTESWSVEDADELKTIIDDFEKRAGMPKYDKNGKIRED